MKVQINDYAKRRQAEYPPVEEQLDALWHAMDRGELPPVPGFYDTLKGVKGRHPVGSSPPGKGVAD